MAAEPEGPPGTRRMLLHRQLLGPRLNLHARVRLVVAVLIAVGTLFATHVVGIGGLAVGPLLGLAAFVFLYNAATWTVARTHRERERDPEVLRRLTLAMHASILLDYAALGVGIWLVGGARSPFLSFCLVHVILGHVNLSRPAALAFTVLAWLLVVALVAVEVTGLLPPPLPEGAVAGTLPLGSRAALTIVVVSALLLGLIAFLLRGIITQLREGERRIRLANAELWRLSDIRRDFLQIAAHNLRSPVGAVSMFLRNLRDGLAGPVNETQTDWIDRSLKRLDGLTGFLDDMQALSDVESGIIEARFEEVSVLPVLEALVAEYRDVAEQKGHTLVLEAPRSLPPVIAHERLLREAAVNYLTNAIRYTPPGGRITVRASATPDAVRVEVEDNGVGIAEEDRARLFQEFVRIDHGGTPVAGERGSGLGLSLVRRIVQAFGGRVEVQSEPGKGSNFALEIPRARV